MTKVHKIVLTGGPCGGKSTGIAKVEQALQEKGYKVYIVEETATQLITSGIVPGEVEITDFQRSLLQLQRQRETIYERTAESLQGERGSVVIYDRGCLDAKAFMGAEMYKNLVECEGYNETELRDHYDGVFHMVTAAKGAEMYYTLENNMARVESTEQAREVDDKLIEVWTGHPHLRVIDNSTDFEGKIHRLLTEIFCLIGEPEPLEIERKYLVEMPDIEKLKSESKARAIEILQTYLNVVGDITEARLRQRGDEDGYSYYYTEKKDITGEKRVERERKITKEEYIDMLMDVDIEIGQVRKTRYCFVEKGIHYELDIYPFWEDKAILEVEVSDEGRPIALPKDIKVIKDVTSDSNYKNRNIVTKAGNNK